MIKLLLLPQNIEVQLPTNSALTNLEFELHGQEAIPFGCRAGACGTCLIEIIDGISSFSEKRKDEADFLVALGYPGEAFRLACQCQVRGTATIRSVVQTAQLLST